MYKEIIYKTNKPEDAFGILTSISLREIGFFGTFSIGPFYSDVLVNFKYLRISGDKKPVEKIADNFEKFLSNPKLKITIDKIKRNNIDEKILSDYKIKKTATDNVDCASVMKDLVELKKLKNDLDVVDSELKRIEDIRINNPEKYRIDRLEDKKWDLLEKKDGIKYGIEKVNTFNKTGYVSFKHPDRYEFYINDQMDYIRKYSFKHGYGSEEAGALEDYFNVDYKYVNAHLRDGTLDSKKDSFVKKINSAISRNKIDDNLQVFRGAALSEESMNKMKIGSMIKDKAFVSTSLSNKTAEGFVHGVITSPKNSKRVLMEIDLPKGTNGVFANNIYKSGEHRYESELLLGTDSKFKVVGVEKQKKGSLDYIVKLKYIK